LSSDAFVYYQAIEFVGTNLVNNTIKLKVNNPSLNINQLNIYNSLGQVVKTIRLNNTIYINENISSLSQGIYYIAAPSFKIEPLKFIKVD
ncbi:MAG: T9SS type A sorting domain-containing protein, partial [Flavobacteriaceae bacterium]|nr:T9SS type A sorting domain-containing protein [Flavobacteriaceae bacterium]